MAENKENKKKKTSEKGFLLSESTQMELQKLIPQVSFNEIMSCNLGEEAAADKTVHYFGKYLGQYQDQFKLNKGMRILFLANEISARDGSLSLYSIFQKYCQTYDEMTWEEFEEIIKPISSISSKAPLQKSGDRLTLTTLGRLLLHNYQKLKAEMLALQKYGEFGDLFTMIDGIRTFWSYNQYGLDIEYIASLINNLKQFVETLRSAGESILKDNAVDSQIQIIYDLISEILELQESGDMDESFSFRQKFKIFNHLIIAIKELAQIARKKFQIRLKKSRQLLLENPFSEMERFILYNWDEKDWSDLFYSSPTCAIPIKLPMKLNKHLVKKALKGFLKKKQEIEYDELPDAPPLIDKKPVEELLINEEELIPLKEDLYQKALESGESLDYNIVRSKDPGKFLNNLLLFYLLASEERLHFKCEQPIKTISDEEFHVEFFTAREFEILKRRTQRESVSDVK